MPPTQATTPTGVPSTSPLVKVIINQQPSSQPGAIRLQSAGNDWFSSLLFVFWFKYFIDIVRTSLFVYKVWKRFSIPLQLLTNWPSDSWLKLYMYLGNWDNVYRKWQGHLFSNISGKLFKAFFSIPRHMSGERNAQGICNISNLSRMLRIKRVMAKIAMQCLHNSKMRHFQHALRHGRQDVQGTSCSDVRVLWRVTRTVHRIGWFSPSRWQKHEDQLAVELVNSHRFYRK